MSRHDRVRILTMNLYKLEGGERFLAFHYVYEVASTNQKLKGYREIS